MQRERITEDIYVFVSDLYAQVTASAVMTNEGVVLIDTLAYPDETKQIKRFIEDRLGARVRYVVNTHFHGDHTTGTCYFEDAQVIAHRRCRELLDQRGRESLLGMQAGSSEMHDVSLVLPNLVFDRELTLYLGDKTLRLQWKPGHSPDSIVCFVEPDEVLFAADTLMPVPYFVDGDYDDFMESLESLKGRKYESVVQGHGEVVLRGEVTDKIQSDIDYLLKLRKAVDQALEKSSPKEALEAISIEQCGKSRILLNGAVQQLHRQNVIRLADKRREHLQVQYPNGQ